MASFEKTDPNYVKLGQVYQIFRNRWIGTTKTFHYIDSILKSGFNVNYAVPAGSPIGNSKPEYLGNTALHFAVEFNKVDIIDVLLENGADVTCRNQNGLDAIQLAFEKELFLNSLITAYIKLGNDENVTDKNGLSYFHISCATGALEAVDFFLKAGVSVDQPVDADYPKFPGYTPLLFAVHYNRKDIVKILLDGGADANGTSNDGTTPLCLVIQKNERIVETIQDDLARDERSLDIKIKLLNESIPIISLLLRATNTSDSNPVDRSGLSHFHVSCTTNNPRFFNKFLYRRVDVNSPVGLDSPAWPGYTPLHFALTFNMLRQSMLLLRRGANLFAKDANGTTPFDLCAKKFASKNLYQFLCTQTQHLRFVDGTSLKDFIGAARFPRQFPSFIKNMDINTCISLESPVWPGFTPLHVAVMLSKRFLKKTIRDEDVDYRYLESAFLVKKVLSLRPDCNVKDAQGLTALHHAVKLKSEKSVDAILEDHFIGAYYLQSLLHEDIGIWNFHVDVLIAEGLLDKDYVEACVMEQDSTSIRNNKTRSWVQNRDESKVGQDSAIINPGDQDNLTHLHIVCARGYRGLIEMYLQSGVDPNVQINRDIEWGNPPFETILKTGTTPLHIILTGCVSLRVHDTIGIMILLLKFGADPNIPDFAGLTPMHYFLKYCSKYRIEPDMEKTFEDLLDQFMNSGADLELKCAEGLNSLHLALKYSCDPKIIIRLMSEMEKVEKWRDDYEMTRLHVACAMRDTTLIIKYYESGDDVNSQIASDSPIWAKDTPLHVLLNSGCDWNDNAVRYLLEHGADLTLQNAKKLTPLHLQFYSRFKIPSESLFPQSNKLIEVNQTDMDGLSHLHLFCASTNNLAIQEFLKSGIDVNLTVDYFAENVAGWTPLHFAVQYKRREAIELLLSYGADVTIENANGHTPLYLAAMESPRQIGTILERCPNIDVNAENVFGETLFEILLRNKSKGHILDILSHGLRISFLKATSERLEDERNIITEAVLELPSSTFESLTKTIPDLINVDETGCNAIHYVRFVKSRYEFCSSEKTHHYVRNIEILVESGCELDQQDNDGRTALHKAVIANDEYYVKALLSIGANVNVMDDHDKTPCAYVVAFVPDEFSYGHKPDETYYGGLRNAFINHLRNLVLVGIRLNVINKKFLFDHLKIRSSEKMRASNNFNDDTLFRLCSKKYDVSRNRNDEVKKLKEIKLTDSLSIGEFFEEKTVRNYPRLPASRRQVIQEFFESDDLRNLLKQRISQDHMIKDWLSVLKFQFRKCLLRCKKGKLIHPAAEYLNSLLELPTTCCEIIAENLDNDDLIDLAHELRKKSK